MSSILAGYPKISFYISSTDNLGNAITIPAAGYKINTYTTGTATPATTYSDQDAQTSNANPVVLDSNGQATIFLDPTVTYRFVITDASDNTIYTIDDITAPDANLTTASDVIGAVDVLDNSWTSSSNGNIDLAPNGNGTIRVHTLDGSYETRITADDDIPNRRYISDILENGSPTKEEVSSASDSSKYLTGTLAKYSPWMVSTNTCVRTSDGAEMITSFNVDNVAKNGSIYTITFDKPYQDTNFVAITGVQESGGSAAYAEVSSKTTGSVVVITSNVDYFSLVCIGKLVTT